MSADFLDVSSLRELNPNFKPCFFNFLLQSNQYEAKYTKFNIKGF